MHVTVRNIYIVLHTTLRFFRFVIAFNVIELEQPYWFTSMQVIVRFIEYLEWMPQSIYRVSFQIRQKLYKVFYRLLFSFFFRYAEKQKSDKRNLKVHVQSTRYTGCFQSCSFKEKSLRSNFYMIHGLYLIYCLFEYEYFFRSEIRNAQNDFFNIFSLSLVALK